MIHRLKNIFASLLVASVFFAPLALTPAIASAQTCPQNQTSIQDCLSTGACLTTTDVTSACKTGDQASSSINNLLITIINIFSLVVGIIAVIMIIVGGIRFVLSGGESSNVSTARNTIIYAIVGLVIVALAQVIVHFVLNRISNT
jgi:cytochrome bd-type quinol oxidase subunit 2